VAVAAHARRVAYSVWAAQATSLGVLTGDGLRGDAMGLHWAGGAAEVQAQALEYGLTPAEVVEAARGTVAFFSEFRAEGLGIVSDVTGRGDGLAMNIAAGAAEVQAQALEYGLTPAEVAEAARGTPGYFNLPAATAAAALHFNPNKALPFHNQDVLRLGEEIGSVVMGRAVEQIH